MPATLAASSTITITIYDPVVTTQQGQIQQIQLVPKYTLSFEVASAMTTIVATAGNFGGNGNPFTTNPNTGIVQDQLLLAYKFRGPNGDQIFSSLFGLNNDGQQLVDFSSVTVRSGGSVTLSRVASGYLSPFPSSSAPAVPSEQAVVSFQGTDEGHLTLLTADTGLNISVAAERTLSGPDTSFIYGVAVGNFGFTDQTLTTLQVAVFTCDGIIPPAYVIGQPFVHLFAISTSVNPQNNQITYS